MFDHYDEDRDGYLTEDQFLSMMEKFSKSESQEICEEIFSFCKSNNNEVVDKQDFFVIVLFI